jgi:sarcosine dehydrogenase
MPVLSKMFFPPIIKALKPRCHLRQPFSTDGTRPSNARNVVPSEADVVIVGGGSLGCQTLYHLAKMGVTNTVLLEKDKLTAGEIKFEIGMIMYLLNIWSCNNRHGDLRF